MGNSDLYLDPAVIVAFVLMQGPAQIREQGLNRNRSGPQEL